MLTIFLENKINLLISEHNMILNMFLNFWSNPRTRWSHNTCKLSRRQQKIYINSWRARVCLTFFGLPIFHMLMNTFSSSLYSKKLVGLEQGLGYFKNNISTSKALIQLQQWTDQYSLWITKQQQQGHPLPAAASWVAGSHSPSSKVDS